MPTTFNFEKAIKFAEKLRMALDGPAGSGKTYTALVIATYLVTRDGGRIAVIDSERSSAKKYADLFDFDHLTLPDFEPETYTGAIKAADKAGYTVMIVDSMSHAWDGVLQRKDDITARSSSGNSYTAWRDVTPIHNQFVNALIDYPGNLIVTMRAKMAYEVTTEKGRVEVTKLGLAPVQREGMEYEFDIVCDIDLDHVVRASKTRCAAIDGKSRRWSRRLRRWRSSTSPTRRTRSR